MSIISTKSRNYLVELVITLVVTGAIILGVTYKLYGEAVRLREITTESQMRKMTKMTDGDYRQAKSVRAEGEDDSQEGLS